MPEHNNRRHGADPDQPTDRLQASSPRARSDIQTTARVSAAPPHSGGQDTDWIQPQQAEGDTEPTQPIPVVQAANAPSGTTASRSYSESLRPAESPAAAEGSSGDKRSRPRGAVVAVVSAGIAVGLLSLLYVTDLALGSGNVPRGTVVAGIAVGGLDKTAAERTLRDGLTPRLHEPVTLQAGPARAQIVPDQAGLSVDFAATIDQAGSQPLNPFTRLRSLFVTHEVEPVTRSDRTRTAAAVDDATRALQGAPTEGTIRFDGAKPIVVEPVAGRAVDTPGAVNALISQWSLPKPIDVPVSEHPVQTTSEGVHRALKEIAEPAVSAPVILHGDHKDAVLSPEAVASALRFEPDGRGGLQWHVDNPAVVASVQPQLAETLRPGQDAKIAIENGAPVVHPSTDGRGIDWDKTLARIPDVLKAGTNRDITVAYAPERPKFTTEQANGLGIREVVSEFTTGGFEPASGVNIRRVAEQVNGAVVKPGDTFSLNGYTGPRGVPQGYIESGIIDNGRPARAIGGGISQFATTLFNADYFAGMRDVEHKEHSFYISRYPAGREATVFEGDTSSSSIDVKFKNNSNAGVLIETQWTPSSITVRFWSTKQYDVTSDTSPRSDPTPPPAVDVPPGQPCVPATGIPGFTVYDTRTIRVRSTGQVIKEPPRKVVYDPEPVVRCPAPPPPPR